MVSLPNRKQRGRNDSLVFLYETVNLVKISCVKLTNLGLSFAEGSISTRYLGLIATAPGHTCAGCGFAGTEVKLTQDFKLLFTLEEFVFLDAL